jgi:membrane-associated protein
VSNHAQTIENAFPINQPPSAEFHWDWRKTSGIISSAVANTIFNLLSEFFSRYGYWAVFFGVLLENVGVPVPGETVLLFAGFLASQGKIRIVPAMLTAMVGATFGAALGYSIGWYGGVPLVSRVLKRFPRLQKQYDESEKSFQKHGRWAVFAARFITGLRVFAGILAGILRMSFLTFMLFSFAGAVCWSIAIGYVGFAFGGNWDRLVHLVARLNRIALMVVAAIAVVGLVAHYARKRKPVN